MKLSVTTLLYNAFSALWVLNCWKTVRNNPDCRRHGIEGISKNSTCGTLF